MTTVSGRSGPGGKRDRPRRSRQGWRRRRQGRGRPTRRTPAGRRSSVCASVEAALYATTRTPTRIVGSWPGLGKCGRTRSPSGMKHYLALARCPQSSPRRFHADDETLHERGKAQPSSTSNGSAGDLPGCGAAYAAAEPYPHIVLDDVLTPEVFERAAAEFPGIATTSGRATSTSTRPSTRTPSPTLGDRPDRGRWGVCSAQFVTFLEELSGIEELMADWTMDGGGLHQTLRGGHLNIHADFSTHHNHETGRGASTSCSTSTTTGEPSGAASWSLGRDMTRARGSRPAGRQPDAGVHHASTASTATPTT